MVQKWSQLYGRQPIGPCTRSPCDAMHDHHVGSATPRRQWDAGLGLPTKADSRYGRPTNSMSGDLNNCRINLEVESQLISIYQSVKYNSRTCRIKSQLSTLQLQQMKSIVYSESSRTQDSRRFPWCQMLAMIMVIYLFPLLVKPVPKRWYDLFEQDHAD